MPLFCCLPCTTSSSCTKVFVSVWAKHRFFQKAKSFSRHPSPNLPLKVWGGLFCVQFIPCIGFWNHRLTAQRHLCWFGQRGDSSEHRKVFSYQTHNFFLWKYEGYFLYHRIHYATPPINAQTHRHYRQELVSLSGQSADFPEKRKIKVLNLLKSPFKEWGVFFRQPKCRANHSLSV